MWKREYLGAFKQEKAIGGPRSLLRDGENIAE